MLPSPPPEPAAFFRRSNRGLRRRLHSCPARPRSGLARRGLWAMSSCVLRGRRPPPQAQKRATCPAVRRHEYIREAPVFLLPGTFAPGLSAA
jgi:hypothetical protein